MLERSRQFAIACGKGAVPAMLELGSITENNTEVTMSKDVPGFVSNALLMPFLNEVGGSLLFRVIGKHSSVRLCPGNHSFGESKSSIIAFSLPSLIHSCRESPPSKTLTKPFV